MDKTKYAGISIANEQRKQGEEQLQREDRELVKLVTLLSIGREKNKKTTSILQKQDLRAKSI